MNFPPLVYAIVLIWNSSTDALACLASLVEQDYSNLRILVVDNASHDGTLQAIAARFPQADLLQLNQNHGYAGGNNFGISQALAAGASYVLLLNPDTIVERTAVGLMVSAAEADPGLGMLGPAIISCRDPDLVYMGGRIDWRSGDGIEILATTGQLDASLIDVEYLPGCALLVKADVIGKIGLLDERYFSYYEDVDWCLRCKHAGYSCAVIPEARVYHQNTADVQVTDLVRSAYYPRRNQFLFIHAHGHNGDWRYVYRILGMRLNEYNLLISRGALTRARTLVDGVWDGMHGVSGKCIRQAPTIVPALFAAAARLYAIRQHLDHAWKQWRSQVRQVRHTWRQRLVHVWQRRHALSQEARQAVQQCSKSVRQIARWIVRPRGYRLAQTLPTQLPPPLPVTVVGYISATSGMGEAARGTIHALRHVHHPLHYIDIEPLPTLRPNDMPANGQLMKGLRVNLVHTNAVNVQQNYQQMPANFFTNKPNVGFWYWEMPYFPACWYGAFALFDEIWVGSRYTQAALSAVAPIPIVHMRPLIQPAVPATIERGSLGLPPKRFMFLFSFDVLSILERKNPWAVIRAFQRAFGAPTQGPLLVLKINNSDLIAGRNDYLGIPQNYMEKLASALENVNGILLDKRYERSVNSALMASCDCYISLHRCEGFGLTIAEAMYFGKPCIATGYSGNMDFTTPANSYLVRYHLVNLERDWGPYESNNYWAEPDEEHAAELMTTVYECQEEAAARGRLAAQDIQRMYGPQAVGPAMQQRLQLLTWHWQSSRRLRPGHAGV